MWLTILEAVFLLCSSVCPRSAALSNVYSFSSGWNSKLRELSNDPGETLVLLPTPKDTGFHLASVTATAARQGSLIILLLHPLGGDSYNVTGNWPRSRELNDNYYTYLVPPGKFVPGDFIGFYNPGAPILSYDPSPSTPGLQGFRGVNAGSLGVGKILNLTGKSVDGYSQRQYGIKFFWQADEHIQANWKTILQGHMTPTKKQVKNVSRDQCRLACIVNYWFDCKAINYDVTAQTCQMVNVTEADAGSIMLEDNNWSSETWYESSVEVTVKNNPELLSSLTPTNEISPPCRAVVSPSLLRATILVLKFPHRVWKVNVELTTSEDFDCTDRCRFLAYRYDNTADTGLFRECDVMPAKTGFCAIQCSCEKRSELCQTVFLRFRKKDGDDRTTNLCGYRARVIL